MLYSFLMDLYTASSLDLTIFTAYSSLDSKLRHALITPLVPCPNSSLRSSYSSLKNFYEGFERGLSPIIMILLELPLELNDAYLDTFTLLQSENPLIFSDPIRY